MENEMFLTKLEFLYILGGLSHGGVLFSSKNFTFNLLRSSAFVF